MTTPDSSVLRNPKVKRQGVARKRLKNYTGTNSGEQQILNSGAVSSRSSRFAFEIEHQGQCVEDEHERAGLKPEIQISVCTRAA